jgi:hypothetical protein
MSVAALDAIRAASLRGEVDEALARTVERLAAGDEVPAEVLADVLPHVPDLVTFLHLVGAAPGAAEVALGLAERERFPAVVPGPDLAAAALWAAWRRLDRQTIRPRLIRLARRQLSRALDAAALGLLADLCKQLDDRDVTKLAAEIQQYASGSLVADAVKTIDAPVAALVARVREAPRVVARGITVRSGPRPGRNEPCPCGSGKKYKKCCADKDDAAAAAPSPVAGMSWDEYLAAGAPGIGDDEVKTLALRDVVRIDLARAEPDTLARLARQAVAYRRWDLAERAVDALEAHAPEDADDMRGQLVGDALFLREIEVARALAAKVRDPAMHLMDADRLHLALLDRPPDALATIEDAALQVLRDGKGSAASELAHGLLRAVPSLGVLVARGCLAVDKALDAQMLLDSIEDARDELGVPPGDPGWDVWDTLYAAEREQVKAEDKQQAREKREQKKMHAALESTQARAKELEAQLAKLREELAAPARATKETQAAPVDDPARRALRDRIATLEAQIREGNEERLELRRLIEDAPVTQRQARPAREEPDELEGDDIADEPERGILIPTFSRAAAEALQDMPAHVAAEAMRTIGQLTAGDRAAWSRVKQAQDLRPPLLMARVGIHHRLLFRASEGRAELLELVTRESLMHTLKRLRRA